MEAQTADKHTTDASSGSPRQQLTPLGAIDTREAALRSGWVADAAARRKNQVTTFNSAV